jgi:serine protease AprX
METCALAQAAEPTGRPPAAIRTRIAAFAVLGVLSAAIVVPITTTQRATGQLVHVIVTGVPGATMDAKHAVERSGGRVMHSLPIVDGVDALLPENALTDVEVMPGIRSVSRDAALQFNGATADPTSWPGAAPYEQEKYPGSLYNVAKQIEADDLWDDGITGKGVGVALIDSGVAPVPSITANLVNGPDLSLDATGGDQDGIDAYGHGTHMAGIIAGREPGLPTRARDIDDSARRRFAGIAPDAKVINVKVATADGSVDVSQVIAALNWVVEHRNDPGMNIRVLNLSFGTDGVQDYTLDPLTYAVEAAWKAGIVVVVAAGNNGVDHPRLNNPAYDPFVIAVGAQDQNGSNDPGDDVVADFSSRGSSARRPDLLAPGRSIVSLRDPGSMLDTDFASARVGDDEFKGSGTSQSAAVVSGAVALLLQRYPFATPDQLKAMLVASGRALKSSGNALDHGLKTIDVDKASSQYLNALLGRLPGARQTFAPATGLGSLDAARGTYRLVDEVTGAVLEGEIDITGAAWNPVAWTADTLLGRTWSGDTWLGRSWSGRTWSGRTWTGRTWSGDAYGGRTWTGWTWSGGDWSGCSWSDDSWAGKRWAGKRWAGKRWAGKRWAGKRWAGKRWAGAAW